MPRRPPERGTNGQRGELLYRVERWAPRHDRPLTIFFGPIRRVTCLVEGHRGLFVRYDRGFRRLHLVQEWPELMTEIAAEGAEFRFGHIYRLDDGAPLPFIKTWEPSVGAYIPFGYG